MVRLKQLKLKLNKLFKCYLFKFHIPHHYPLKYLADLSSNDQYINGYGNLRAYFYYHKDSDVVIDNYLFKAFYQYLKSSYHIILLGLITIIILINARFTIHNVKFKQNSVQDFEVYNEVVKCLSKRGLDYTLNTDLALLNDYLRLTFHQYAFINVSIVNRTLFIDLRNKQQNYQNIYPVKPHKYIAKYHGYITGLKVEHGEVLKGINEVVKKGEELLVSNDNLPKGMIFGNTLITKTYIINKKYVKKTYQETKRKLNFLNYRKHLIFDLKKRNDDYIIIDQKVNFLSLLYIVNEIHFTPVYKTYDISIDEALKIAKSNCYEEFNQHQVDECEKINELTVIDVITEEDKYIIKMLINANLNLLEEVLVP